MAIFIQFSGITGSATDSEHQGWDAVKNTLSSKAAETALVGVGIIAVIVLVIVTGGGAIALAGVAGGATAISMA